MSPAVASAHASPLRRAGATTSRTAYGWALLIPSILVIRTLVFVVGVISVHTVHSLNQVDAHNASGFPWMAFDSHFYRYLLLNGYPPGPQVPYQIAYFPLFPFASRALLPLFAAFASQQTAAYVAMLVLSTASAIVGLCFTYAWARTITDTRTAFIATLLTCLLPGAVFFSGGLTEGLFLMFVAITLYLMQKERLYTAAIVCGVGSACRPTSVALAITLVLWTVYHSRNLPMGRLAARVILIGAISVAGAASYEAFLWHRYHRIDAYKVAEDKWDVSSDPIDSPGNQQILEGVDQTWSSANLTATTATIQAHELSEPAHPKLSPYSPAFVLDLLSRTSVWNRFMALALLGIIIAAACQSTVVPRLLLVLPSVILLMTYLPNNGLRVSSIIRYESGAIPLFVVIAIWLSAPRRRPLLLAIGGLSLVIQAYYGFLFCRGHWVG
jgi:hypothetical protein